jgi:hypothetical protein
MDKKDLVKELTFYMGDKSHEELFAIIREACRKDTRSWRAYERIHALYYMRELTPENEGQNDGR